MSPAVRLALVLVPLLACRVDAKVKASTSEGAEASASSDTPPEPAPGPAVSSVPVADAPEAAPAAPPAGGCPLLCFEARGPARAELTAEENAQLRTSLEPLLSRMRSCASPEEWRRLGSPTMNLRIAPDGQLAELGLDPHYASVSSCIYDSEKGSTNVALPGRKVVRCAERCVREPSRRVRRRTP